MDLEKTMRSLKGRGFIPQHFATAKEAADYLCSQIENTTVAIGGSKTVEALGVYDRLTETNQVFWHWTQGATEEVYDGAGKAEVYLSSANALAESGEMVNIDGRGNRVAALTFAENKRLYLIVSTKKICPDLTSAIERARTVAAPTNVKKLPGNRPCNDTGKCFDCRSPHRGCATMQIMMFKPMTAKQVEVLLVDEELGF